MSDIGGPRPALGVGSIVGDSFAVFFRRIGWFTLLALIPLVVVYGLTFGLLGAAALQPEVAGAGLAQLLAMLLQTVGFTFAIAFLVQAAYDTKLGRPVRLGAYIGGALGRFVPLVLCSIIVTVCVYLGTLALIVPGIWIFAVWSVVVPVIVIERAGFDALGRSAALTREYRWPIAGVMILLGIAMVVFSFVVSFLVSFVLSFVGPSVAGFAAALIAQVLGMAMGFGIMYVGIALVYARLREIKEGAGVEALTDVFA